MNKTKRESISIPNTMPWYAYNFGCQFDVAKWNENTKIYFSWCWYWCYLNELWKYSQMGDHWTILCRFGRFSSLSPMYFFASLASKAQHKKWIKAYNTYIHTNKQLKPCSFAKNGQILLQKKTFEAIFGLNININSILKTNVRNIFRE